MNWLIRLEQAIEDFFINVFHDPLAQQPSELSMNQPDAIQTPSIIEPTTTNMATLDNFCIAIRDYEGAPGDRNYRNNNPGNCRYSSVGYLPIYGHVGKDPNNFAVFKDMETGMLYLHNLVKEKVAKNVNQTIYQFMQSYAPTSDGNDPLLYAQFIAKRLGVDIHFPMSSIVAS